MSAFQAELQTIVNTLSVLQHLQEKIEGVWQVFFADDPALLPLELAHEQLEQATVALDRQIKRTLLTPSHFSSSVLWGFFRSQP